MWHLLKTEQLWVPSVDFGTIYTPTFSNLIGTGENVREEWEFFIYQYATLWYNSTLAFLMVEINPRKGNQIILMVGLYILNAIINAVLFGVFVDQFIIIRSK